MQATFFHGFSRCFNHHLAKPVSDCICICITFGTAPVQWNLALGASCWLNPQLWGRIHSETCKYLLWATVSDIKVSNIQRLKEYMTEGNWQNEVTTKYIIWYCWGQTNILVHGLKVFSVWQICRRDQVTKNKCAIKFPELRSFTEHNTYLLYNIFVLSKNYIIYFKYSGLVLIWAALKKKIN